MAENALSDNEKGNNLFLFVCRFAFLALSSIKQKVDYEYFEFKIVEGISMITILLFVISLVKSLNIRIS